MSPVTSNWASSLWLFSSALQLTQHVSCHIKLGKLLMAVLISTSTYTACLLSHQIGQAPYGCSHQHFNLHSMSPVISNWASSLWLFSSAVQLTQHVSCHIKLGKLLMAVLISTSTYTACLLSHQIGQAPYSWYH